MRRSPFDKISTVAMQVERQVQVQWEYYKTTKTRGSMR